jgi:hypothetical protein
MLMCGIKDEKVELLRPAERSKIGERIKLSEIDMDDEYQPELKPKKKID